MSRTTTALLLLILATFGVFYFSSSLPLSLNSKDPQITDNETHAPVSITREDIARIREQNIAIPPPLRLHIDPVDPDDLQSFLTPDAIVMATNERREALHLPMLAVHPLLEQAAERKIADMFSRQYFAHTSPAGIDIGAVASDIQYEYISIGENLALGNFKNDEVLVDAWMNSPGHRANIINQNFQEIGVAARQGIFEGKATWLAVQVFAKPLSACTKPSVMLSEQIDQNKSSLAAYEKTLTALNTDIENTTPKRGALYREKITAYNALVDEYNTLIRATKSLIEDYNMQVHTFNSCAGGL
jgi:hypothetical protein